MTKPKPYTGKDAVKITCMRSYQVQAGDGEEGDKYEEGTEYSVAPQTAAHLLRKMYNVRQKDDRGNMIYVGDAPMFLDSEGIKAAKAEAKAAEKAAADAEKAEKAAAKK